MTTSSLTIEAPAKINLFLKVLGRREDGYHDIYSLVQTINLSDTLTFEATQQGIELDCSSPEAPSDETNLVWKAARLIEQEVGMPGGVRIRLEKRIPVGAGLGGGSSDAAAALMGLKRLFNLDIAKTGLSELALALGSDVPLFLTEGQCLISGRGERIETVSIPMNYTIRLVVPSFSVSTAWAYSELRFPLTIRRPTPNFFLDKTGQDFYKRLSYIGNDFMDIVVHKYPDVASVMKSLWRAGAKHVELTGTGSAFYGLFEGEPLFDVEREIMARNGWKMFNLSPVCRKASRTT